MIGNALGQHATVLQSLALLLLSIEMRKVQTAIVSRCGGLVRVRKEGNVRRRDSSPQQAPDDFLK
jgi:hypothetical protein